VPTFLNKHENPSQSEAEVVVMSVEYDNSTNRKGAQHGPNAIITASHQIEWEAPITGKSLKIKIHNVGTLSGFPNSKKMVNSVYDKVKEILSMNKKLILLGGDHSVSIGAFKAIKEVHGDVCVVQIDAHLDMRDELDGDANSHGSVMRRARELGLKTIQIGIRDHISDEEREYALNQKLEKHIWWCATQPKKTYSPNEQMIFDGEIKESQIKKILKSITAKNVYITIDIDGIDPKEMPATGTPLPHGLTYDSAKNLMYSIIKYCNKQGIKIIGFDITEVSPFIRDTNKPYSMENVIDTRTEQNAALLIYNMLCWMYE
jgi:agmatinase